MATPYVCQQCRLKGYPDCRYEFHPTPRDPDDDHYRRDSEKLGR